MPRSVQISILGGGGGGGVLKSQNPKLQDLSKFQFSGGGWVGGCSGKSKFKVPRSAHISIFRGRGCSGKSKPKVPRSVQILIWGGGGAGGVLNQIPEQGCSEQFGQKFLEA